MRRYASTCGGALFVAAILTVLAPSAHAATPVISSSPNGSATAGLFYSYTITANNGPLSFGATPLAGTGLSINTATGVLSGTPPATGTFIIDLQATNGGGTGHLQFTLTVNPSDPVIITGFNTFASVGVPFSFTVTASGIPAPTITTSTLPAGLILGPASATSNSSSLVITGIPQPAASGPSFVTLTAHNISNHDDVEQLTINISQAPVITSPLVATGDSVNGISYTITATNPLMLAQVQYGIIDAPGLTFATTGSATANSSTLNVASAAGLVVGDTLVGAPGLSTITTTGTTNVGSNMLTVASAAGLVIGDSLATGSAGGFSPDTTILNIAGTTLTMSSSAQVTQAGGLANFLSEPSVGGFPISTTIAAIAGTTLTMSAQATATQNGRLNFVALNCNSITGLIKQTGVIAQGTYPVIVSATNKLAATVSACTFNNTIGTGTATVAFAISPAAGVPQITSTLQVFGIESSPFVYGTTISNPPALAANGFVDSAGKLTALGLSIDPGTGIVTGIPAKLALPYICFSGDTANTNAVITNVTNTAGITTGQPIFGPTVPSGTTVTGVNVAGPNTVTMSAGATADFQGECFINQNGPLPGPTPLFTGTITAGSPIIGGVASTVGMALGAPVFGPGILSNTTIVSLTPTSVTISQSATVTLANTQAFITGVTTACPIKVTNSTGSTTTSVNITISPAVPQITIPASEAFQQTIAGNPYAFQANATSFPDPTITATQYFSMFSPILPSGNVSISESSGLLSGTPVGTSAAPGDANNYTVTLTSQNNRGYSNAQFSLTIGVQPVAGTPSAPVIQPPYTAVAYCGCPFTYQIVTIPSTNLFASNTLNGGFHHLVLNTGTGLVSGTPLTGTIPVSTTGSTTNGVNTITVASAAGLAVDQTLVNGSSGGFPQVPATTIVSITGGNVLHMSANATITQAGGQESFATVPSDVGVYNIDLEAEYLDSQGNLQTGSQVTLNLTILASPNTPPGPTLLPPLSVGTVVGTALDYAVVTSPNIFDPTQNQLPIFFSAPQLPTGLVLSPASVLLPGNPLADINGFSTQTGTTNVPVTTINATGTDTKAIAFTVAGITIFNPNPPNTLTATGTVGQNFSFQIFGTGSPNTFGVDPASPNALPLGLTLNPRTGLISGIPASPPAAGAAAVVYNVLVTASNGTGVGKATLVITINSAPNGSPSITNANAPPKPAAPPLIVNVFDSVPFGQFDSTGTFQSDAFTITATNMPASPVSLPNQYGAIGLPNGISVDATTGIFTGKTSSLGSFSVVISATNANGSDARTLTLNVLPIPPVLTTPSITIPFGSTLNYQILPNPNPGSQPITFSLTFNGVTSPPAAKLPAPLDWLSVSGASLQGTPPAPGAYGPLTLTAQNTSPISATATFTIIVTAVPAFTLASNTATGVVGDPSFSFPVTVTGFPAPVITVDPTTPIGLPGPLSGFSFPNPAASGAVLTGTPTAAGSFNVIFDANNGVGPIVTTQALPAVTINISHMMLTSPSVAAGAEGVPFTYNITATGHPLTFEAQNFPSFKGNTWVSLSGNTLSINPPAGSGGTYVMQIKADNAKDTTGFQDLVLAISTKAGAPAITNDPLLVEGVLGTPIVGFVVTATNNPTSFNFVVNGASTQTFNGLTIDSATGIILGIPTVAGSSTVTVAATNGIGSGFGLLTVAIASDPSTPLIVSPLTASGTQLSPFSYQIKAITFNNGADVYTFSAGNLPALGSVPNNVTVDPVTGVISGTPGNGGVFNVPIVATSTLTNKQGSAILVITLSKQSPAITSPLTASGIAGSFFTYTITATGSAPITFSASNLPSWLTFDGVNTLSGTPPINGNFTATLTASNNFPPPDTETLQITIVPAPPNIISPNAVTGIANEPFSFTVQATGSAPITFAATPLPAGLSIDPNSGIISGITTQTGTFTVNVTAQNTIAGVVNTATQVLTITIVARPDDSDGDGFPDDDEVALGTNPFNAASTPFNGRPATVAHPVQVINITAMQIKLNFTGGAKDAITASGTISVEPTFTPAGHQLTLVIPAQAGFTSTPPGIVRTFLLGGKGTATSATLADGKTSASGSNAFKITVSRKKDAFLGRVASFQIKLASGTDFEPVLATRGLTNGQTFKNAADVVRMSFLLDPTSQDPIFYDSQKVVIWNVKKGKAGTAKPGRGNQNLNPNP